MEKKDFKEKLNNVNQFKISEKTDIKSLMESLAGTGFNAKRLAHACEIYRKMIQDEDCVKFFGLAGAMVPVGMQRIIHDFIAEDYIDILVTTGANLTHDIAETLGYHHLQGDIDPQELDDASLHKEKMNRIFDVFLPDDVYMGIEDFISELDIPELNMPVSEFLAFLGKELPENPNSILKICADKEIPIFCPAFTDCGLALQLGFHFRKMNLNHFKDMMEMVDIAWDAKHAGVCIVGGGVPKNFIFQSLQFCPTSAKYAIQITTDRPEPGGLSGATLDEAISWGKVNEKAQKSMLISDATIALPIILWYLKSIIK
ncbi:MAG: deoxyhypusine synthase [Promethearchaeota archaeon]|nr:MAG: deoxyhypusine synthase [Candidatus Lokiarchaeota archaeon]